MHEESIQHEYRHTMQPSVLTSAARWAPATFFAAVAVLAIIGGGLIAAAVAHAPTQHSVWMVAYLVLVVGVAQLVLGVGQALLAVEKLPTGLLASQCGIFNLGNVGVIAGTLFDRFSVVVVGSLLFIVALGLFLYGVRNARGHPLLYAYQGVLVLMGMSAIVGIVLAAMH